MVGSYFQGCWFDSTCRHFLRDFLNFFFIIFLLIDSWPQRLMTRKWHHATAVVYIPNTPLGGVRTKTSSVQNTISDNPHQKVYVLGEVTKGSRAG